MQRPPAAQALEPKHGRWTGTRWLVSFSQSATPSAQGEHKRPRVPNQAGGPPADPLFVGIDGLGSRNDLEIDEHREDIGDRIDMDDLVTLELDPREPQNI